MPHKMKIVMTKSHYKNNNGQSAIQHINSLTTLDKLMTKILISMVKSVMQKHLQTNNQTKIIMTKLHY